MDYGIIVRIKNITAVLVAFGIIVFAVTVYISRNRNIVPYNQYPDGSVLAAKNTYVYPYKTLVVIYKDGTVKKSKIVDEITDKGEPKEQFKDINELSAEEIRELERLIAGCEAHRKYYNIGEFKGVLLKTSLDSTLETGENFEEVYVKALEEFIDRASNVQ